MTDLNVIKTELDELDTSIGLLQTGHQSSDHCNRELLPAYGGPGKCSECDDYDKMRERIQTIQTTLKEAE